MQPAGHTGGISAWPWSVVLLAAILIVGTWRFRSWIMGVFENVVILGRSGADLETELLYHEANAHREASIDEEPPGPPES
jgi:hypothetical protein